MLRRQRPERSGIRAALHDARETYRKYSGAEPNGAELNGAAPNAKSPPQPRSPALAERGWQAARRLSRERRHRTPGQHAEPAPAHTQRDNLARTTARPRDEDVVLDVSRLHVDEIDLNIDELKARVALEAHVLDLLRLDVGVSAELRGVGLQIKGVDARALLKVRLENLSAIVDRVMSTVDRNPQILERLTERLGEGAGSAVKDVGGIARALSPDAAKPNGAHAG
jgi:uncharacterized protein involved in outer membrane biogenesis